MNKKDLLILKNKMTPREIKIEIRNLGWNLRKIINKCPLFWKLFFKIQEKDNYEDCFLKKEYKQIKSINKKLIEKIFEREIRG